MNKVIVSLGALALSMTSLGALAQSYPAKPIHILTSEPGGNSDTIARVLAQKISTSLGQPVLVENRPPAQTISAVANAVPDGYTLLIYGSVIWVQPLMQKDAGWSMDDFAPIAPLTVAPQALVVPASLPVNSVKELIAYAKANPGKLNYATAGIGSTTQLGAELFKAMSGTDIVQVNYRGNGEAFKDVITGRIQVMFPAAGALVNSEAKAGRIRILGIGSLQPSALAPGIPTIASQGISGYESGSLLGLLAPVKTPQPIVLTINREVGKVLTSPEVKDAFFKLGQETVSSTPEEFKAKIASEVDKWAKVIQLAGIKAD